LQEVEVSSDYTIKILKKTREKLEIKRGDKLLLREEGEMILIDVPRRISNPSELLWSLSKKPHDVDVLKLVEK
jgi:bifunctional DNA-binding transcriptional regulator/antitoxin component of YhaV-PrlF toxin-antitoxin module